MKIIDPHVHCRDGRESFKHNLRKLTEVATKQGVSAIFIMPDARQPILKDKAVLANLSTKCFIYAGLTADERQIQEAVKDWKKYSEIIGLTPVVSHTADLQKIYKTLAKEDYTGVLAVHCEKTEMLQPDLWKPIDARTLCLARPPKSEIVSVRDQIRFARKAGFRGHLHICHISCPESVDLVWKARKHLKITSAVTPYHILWSSDRLRDKIGLFYTTNPPLRDNEMVFRLKQYLKNGKIAWIETDHTPNVLLDKIYPPYWPGFPSLELLDILLDWLNRQEFSQEEIERLTYWNIKEAFGDKLKGI